MVELSIYLYWL